MEKPFPNEKIAFMFVICCLPFTYIMTAYLFFQYYQRDCGKKVFFFPSIKIVSSIILKVLDAILLIVLPAQIYMMISLKAQDSKDKCVFCDSPLTCLLLLRKQDKLCACSRGIEKLHYASLLGRLQRVEEESQVINQAMAELATIPYLQDISQQDAELVSIYF